MTRLRAQIEVGRDVHTVWKFLADPLNAPNWDKSVAQVIPASSDQPSTGWVAQTVSSRGKRQLFRITSFKPGRALAFELLGDPMFDHAVLRFDLTDVGASAGQTTRVVHTIKMRTNNPILGIALAAVGKRALTRDLNLLRSALIICDTAADA